ncbi:MAG: hypothetical protein ACLVKS_05210, partial [Peptococcus niger]
ANEVAVAQFLDKNLGFLAIADVAAETMAAFKADAVESLAHLSEVDQAARAKAQELCRQAGDRL